MDKLGAIGANENPQTALKLLEKLDAHKVDYQLWRHKAVVSAEEGAKMRGVLHSDILKSMIMKVSKKDKFYLCAILGNDNINNKLLRWIINHKYFSFARPEHLSKLTNVI